MLLKSLVTLALLNFGTEAQSHAEERFAALECQNKGYFVLINFYPNNHYQLSWGQDEILFDADIEVTRQKLGRYETFSSNNISLKLPIESGGHDSTLRIGSLSVVGAIPAEWSNLKCHLFPAD
jgi:hypothetical protein